MRRLALAGSILLGGCAAAQPPIHGETPGYKCESSASGQFLGQPATSELGAAIMRETHAATLRWAPPGVMLTMDYREDRVTVRLGPDHRVAAINCG